MSRRDHSEGMPTRAPRPHTPNPAKRRRTRAAAALTTIVAIAFLAGCTQPTQPQPQPEPGSPDAPQSDPPDPQPVTALAATAGDATVDLTWTDPDRDDLVSLEVTWSPDGDTPQTVDPGVESYSATGLTNGSEYAFTVTTVFEDGQEAAADPVTATPDGTAPSTAPRLLSPQIGEATGADTRPTFRWTPVPDGSTVDIQAAALESFSEISVLETFEGLSGTSFRPAAEYLAARGEPIYFRIREVNAEGPGPWSSELGDRPLRFAYVGRAPADLNGDGYSEVIAGARDALAGGTSSSYGVVHVYYGGESTAERSALGIRFENRQESDSSSDRVFGTAVTSVGDIDGDGYADLAIGHPDYKDSDGQRTGAVFLVMGEDPTSTPVNLSTESGADYTLFAPGTPLGRFGSDIAPAGDVNADGFNDFLVAEYDDSASGDPAAMAAHLYLGGSTLDTDAHSTYSVQTDNMGVADVNANGPGVSGAGDVNGDGYADYLVGIPTYNSNTGRVLLFTGSAGPAASPAPALTIDGASSVWGFGTAVSAAGDVNADGYADFLIGSLDREATLYFGGPDLDALESLRFPAPYEEAGSYGVTLAGLGDFTGDGYDDIVIGAHGDYSQNSDRGRVFVYYGGEQMDTTWDRHIRGRQAGENAGWPVVSPGDVNGDGLSDLLLGAPDHVKVGDGGGNVFAGEARLYLGVDGPISDDVTYVGPAPDTNQAFGIGLGRSR